MLSAVFVLWTVLSVLQKPVFLLLHVGEWAQAFGVMMHGLRLDLSIAGYLSAVPALLLLLGSLPLSGLHDSRGERWMARLLRGWMGIAALLSSLSFVANLALYSYWQFPLDSSPVFFITTSPRDAMASIEWWQGLLGVAAVAVLTLLVYGLMCRVVRHFEPMAYRSLRPWGCLAMVLVVAVLFLPIRGGIDVGTVNTGSAYFSDNPRLNHAAVNPLFSFMESMNRQADFDSQYRFMDDAEARRIAAPLLKGASSAKAESRQRLLSADRPDIYLIILESFSDTLMQQHGVTPSLESLKREGVVFTRFYANSYRTDRGLLSILHGYPSPATVSLMKYPGKTAKLPSMAGLLKQHGWGLRYYYGGDADFTNMRSFLVNQGFSNIVEDVDFPVSDRLSKWGVPDHLLFRRVEQELRADRSQRPQLRVIQTSSSHEPFDVPYHRLAEKSLNAFAYVDSCVGGFVKFLKATGRWNRSLVVLVPDHLGAWPAEPDNFKSWRFHVPMIWTGGAIARPGTVATYGSQQDIAATLLAQLRIDHKALRFSKDLMDTARQHFAFFMMNDGFGWIDDAGEVIYDHKLQRAVVRRGQQADRNLELGKAYTQTIFDDIASR